MKKVEKVNYFTLFIAICQCVTAKGMQKVSEKENNNFILSGILRIFAHINHNNHRKYA